MKASEKCTMCFFKQVEHTADMLKLKSKKREKLLSLVTKKLIKFDFNNPATVFGRTIYKAVSEVSGIKDPFKKEKIRTEKHLLKSDKIIHSNLAKAKDRLRVSAKMSCAANSIDFGAGKQPSVNKLLTQLKNVRLTVNHFSLFQDKLKKAKSILFIGDNCGEGLFDKIFIEEITRCFPKLKIFYAVRSAPVLNDMVLSDAKRIGLDKVAKVFSSGCDYPGIMLNKTSNPFKKVYSTADIIISKGQGNFEAFEDRKKDIFYLFKVKCPAVSDYTSLKLGSLLFLYNKKSSFHD